MKVMHYINNLAREGAQVMVANLVTAANETGISFCVCVRRPGGALAAELRAQGVVVAEPQAYFGFRSIRRSVAFLRQQCVEQQTQLLHAHMADAAFIGWLVARQLKLPLVISHHGHDILLKCNPLCRSVYYLLLFVSARHAAMNIAVSESVAARLRKLLALGPDRVRVIGNGVRIPEAARLEARAGGSAAPVSALRLVNVGRLVPLKGQRQLVLAMIQLAPQFPGLRLSIVGDGELAPELRQLAAARGVAEIIEFSGSVDNVDDYLAKADIYVSSSQSEGMPVSILEAMAWRLPVVASDIPGNRSVVRQGETGFLYHLNNVDDLVSTIAAVARDAATAAAAARRAHSMVEQDYSVETCLQKHTSLYQAIGQQRTPAVAGV